MSENPPKLIELFERATKEDLKEPDIGLNIEIADRMNFRRRYCLEGIEYFKQLFKSSDLRSVTLTLSLLETCVKNCNINFHRYINNRNLMPSIIGLLKRKRKKLNVVEKLAGLYKAPGWRSIEDRVLALVQLWADTFMMHEDKFPCFMRAYRELRKEQLKFPPRDPNERFMINFEGEPSPAFELADMEQPVQPDGPQRIEVRKEPEDEEPVLTAEDLNTLKVLIPRLEDIVANASDAKEFQDPNVKDVVRKCRNAQRKLVWFVSFRASQSLNESETFELLEVMDYVNAKMDSFKVAARMIKRGAPRHEVRSALQIKEEKKSDLLDEDFLELPEQSPFEKLEKYVGNEEVKQEELPPPEVEVPVIEPVHDLLFDDGPVDNPQLSGNTGLVDQFGLGGLVFDALGGSLQPSQPPSTGLIDFSQPGYNQPNPNTFNQPDSSAYSQPPQPHSTGFNQPNFTGFNQPNPTGFNQPNPTGFSQPNPTGFNQPNPTGFSQPNPMGLNQPNPGYNQPNPTGYTQPNPTEFMQPNPTGYSQPNPVGFNQPNPMGYTQPNPAGFAPTNPQGVIPGFGQPPERDQFDDFFSGLANRKS